MVTVMQLDLDDVFLVVRLTRDHEGLGEVQPDDAGVHVHCAGHYRHPLAGLTRNDGRPATPRTRLATRGAVRIPMGVSRTMHTRP